MELASRLAAFEKFRLDAEFRDDSTLQCVRTSHSSPRTWQVWKRARSLGGGHFGKVWQERLRGANGDWQYRALKVCPQEQMNNAGIDYKRELSALAAFSGSKYAGFFVSFYGWWMDSQHVFVAMEYIGKGDLSTYVFNGLEEDEAKEVADNLLNGLSVMHQEGFTHRDIKPQNILVVQKRPEHQRWWVKIGDFGISKRILEDSGTSLHSSVGTRPYCAPEVLGYLQDYEQSSAYSSKVDMWSLGCVLFNIGSRGHLAFSESDLVRYVDGRLSFNHTARKIHFGTDGVSLINWLLQPDPERRLSAIEALRHPWLSEGQHPSASISSMETYPEQQSGGLSKSPSIRPLEKMSIDHRNYNSFLQSTFSSQSSNDGNSDSASTKPDMSDPPPEWSEKPTIQGPQISSSKSAENIRETPTNRVHPGLAARTRTVGKSATGFRDDSPVESAEASSASLDIEPESQDRYRMVRNNNGKDTVRNVKLTTPTEIQRTPQAMDISVRMVWAWDPKQRNYVHVDREDNIMEKLSSSNPTLIFPWQLGIPRYSGQPPRILKYSDFYLRPRAFVSRMRRYDFPEPKYLEGFTEVKYYHSNFVLDLPMAPKFLGTIPHAKPPERDEFTHVRYTALDCDPTQLGDNKYTFRPALFAKPRTTEILISISLGGQASAVVGAHLRSVLISVQFMSEVFGSGYWKKIVVLIVGVMGKIHPSVYAILSALGVYCQPFKAIYEHDTAPQKDYHANIFEYTSQKSLNVRLNGVVEVVQRSKPCQLIFVEALDDIEDCINAFGVGMSICLRPSMMIEHTVGLDLPVSNTFFYEEWMKSLSEQKSGQNSGPSPAPSLSPSKTFFVQTTTNDKDLDKEYLDNLSLLNFI